MHADNSSIGGQSQAGPKSFLAQTFSFLFSDRHCLRAVSSTAIKEDTQCLLLAFSYIFSLTYMYHTHIPPPNKQISCVLYKIMWLLCDSNIYVALQKSVRLEKHLIDQLLHSQRWQLPPLLLLPPFLSLPSSPSYPLLSSLLFSFIFPSFFFLSFLPLLSFLLPPLSPSFSSPTSHQCSSPLPSSRVSLYSSIVFKLNLSQASIKLLILLPQPSDYRHVSPHPAPWKWLLTPSLVSIAFIFIP